KNEEMCVCLSPCSDGHKAANLTYESAVYLANTHTHTHTVPPDLHTHTHTHTSLCVAILGHRGPHAPQLLPSQWCRWAQQGSSSSPVQRERHRERCVCVCVVVCVCVRLCVCLCVRGGAC